MSDEIRKSHFAPDGRQPQLTTADLAGARQATRLDPELDGEELEYVVEGEVEELPANALPAEAARTVADAASPQAAATATARALEEETGPLFSTNESKDLRARWDTIQVGFVDEPRRAVQQADTLVAETMKRLAEIFAQERSNLEAQWDKNENVSTENLRQALRRYRSFFARLLAI
jgi:hypothetical protein